MAYPLNTTAKMLSAAGSAPVSVSAELAQVANLADSFCARIQVVKHGVQQLFSDMSTPDNQDPQALVNRYHQLQQQMNSVAGSKAAQLQAKPGFPDMNVEQAMSAMASFVAKMKQMADLAGMSPSVTSTVSPT